MQPSAHQTTFGLSLALETGRPCRPVRFPPRVCCGLRRGRIERTPHNRVRAGFSPALPTPRAACRSAQNISITPSILFCSTCAVRRHRPKKHGDSMFAREQPPRPSTLIPTPSAPLPLGCPHASLSGERHHTDRKVHTSPQVHPAKNHRFHTLTDSLIAPITTKNKHFH